MVDRTGAVKFRMPLGPVGARNPAGPRGGDLGATGRTGDRSRGVDLAESLSRYGICAGDLSRISGERGLDSRAVGCVRCKRSGWIGGEERREVFPDVLPEGGEGDRRLQFAELGPVGTRSSLRSMLRERCRKPPRGPAGGDLRNGDLGR